MTASPTKRRYTAADPAPEAVRCPTPGCFRRRNPADRRGGRTDLCQHCRTGGARSAAKPKPPRTGRHCRAYALTADVPADVYPVRACGESSVVPPESRVVPAGTLVVAVGGQIRCDGGDPVVELVECRGRFVCPRHAMKLLGAKS